MACGEVSPSPNANPCTPGPRFPRRPRASLASVTFDLEIRDESIRLGQLLKLSGLVDDGAHARAVIEVGEVSVNGEVEIRRGRQVRVGDLIAFEGNTLRVVQA
ncbi:MAG: RNA-binding S4 domain-containing protein [Tetrasphaera sp.]|nr:RNA-binding S4 domain-containing protein [Tetrasphaera sp.]